MAIKNLVETAKEQKRIIALIAKHKLQTQSAQTA
jgi:hypothetical protein